METGPNFQVLGVLDHLLLSEWEKHCQILLYKTVKWEFALESTWNFILELKFDDLLDKELVLV